MAGQIPDQARVLIVDDERETRVLLRAFLEEEGVTVVGEGSSGKEALYMVNRLLPDVVLMDVRMPGMNGIDATRHIRARHPQVQVIILTFLGADEWTSSANEVGAFAYLLKGTAPSVLVGHIWRAAVAAHSVQHLPVAETG
jgi:DNA-binding NarL/FixJ family response regulator